MPGLIIRVAALIAIGAAQVLHAQRSDTTIVNAGTALHPGGGTLKEELSIGGPDVAVEYQFKAISDITVDAKGFMYVVDWQLPAVFEYDPAGRFVRRFGRLGEGPGEYQRPTEIKILPDGRVVVLDFTGRRLLVYSSDGTPTATWRLPNTTQGSTRLFADTAGFIYVLSGPEAIALHPESPPLVRFNGKGEITDTIPLPPFPLAPILKSGNPGSGMTARFVPYWPVGAWTVSPFGSLVSGYPAKYAFEIRRNPPRTAAPRAAGPVVSIRRLGVPAMAVSDADRAEMRASVDRSMRRFEPNWGWSGPDMPRTQPFYTKIVAGLDGRLWVNRDAYAYDVFEPEGRYLGEVQGISRMFAMRGDVVWGSASDAEGVAYVKRFRVVWK